MKILLVTVAVFLICCANALAGGDSFLIEIVSITPKGNEEYRMEFVQYGAPYGRKLEGKPKLIVLHLRYNEKLFGSGTTYTSRVDYQSAIVLLKTQAATKAKVLFGVMGQGYLPIEGKDNEFQSNALEIGEQFDGKRVVISYHRKL